MLVHMASGLRIVIASYGSAQFEFLRQILADMGHVPIAYPLSRFMRPATAAEPDLLNATKAIVADVSPGMDLLLPGCSGSVVSMLAGYRPDLLLVFGFNWRLPRDVLELPGLGALNVHPSTLPKYRGPSPVPWAIRNGDPFMGVTIHRMTEQIDAGPVLAQVDDIPIPEQVTAQDTYGISRRPMTGCCRSWRLLSSRWLVDEGGRALVPGESAQLLRRLLGGKGKQAQLGKDVGVATDGRRVVETYAASRAC
jgi:hypothetical protein